MNAPLLLPDGLPAVISTRLRPPPPINTLPPGLYCTHSQGGGRYDTPIGPPLTPLDALEVSLTVVPIRGDGWPMPLGEQGWDEASTAALLQEHSLPPLRLLPPRAHCPAAATTPRLSKWTPRAAASYELTMRWFRNGTPVFIRTVRCKSPRAGSIAKDCIALALDWEPVAQTASQYVYVWCSRQ